MRKDVKIGIAVGLFLAIVASVYFFVASGGDESEPVVDTLGPGPEATVRVTVEDPVVEPDPTSTDLTPIERVMEGAREDETRTALAPVRPVIPGPIEIRRVDDGLLDDPTTTVTDRSAVSTDVDNALAPVGPDRTPLSETLDDPGGTADPEAFITPVVPVTSVGPLTPRALTPDPMDSDIMDSTEPAAENFYSNVRRIYIVQHGDNGFWTVSARMYGDGKYFGVIADANPNVDSSSLRPFQRLIVPPLPEKYRRKPVEPIPVGGFIGIERTYVVQKGDAGFWGVAVKVYGHGKYYKTIAKANPGVNSETLRPGQRLLIPPKPVDPSGPGAGDTGIIMTDLPIGYKVYVVRRGDAGFWDVAVKMYGNGRHFGLVARANPGVDSRRLQPGQKLRIPPMGEVRRLTSAATAPFIEERPVEIMPAGTDPRPIFE